MGRGLGPSLDQQDLARRRILLAVGVAAVVLAGGLLVLRQPDWERREAFYDSLEPDLPSGEEDRPAAFAAAKSYVLGQLNAAAIRRLVWLEVHHEGHYGYYRFDGRIAVEDIEKRVRRMPFEVAVSRREDGSWKLEQVRIGR